MTVPMMIPAIKPASVFEFTISVDQDRGNLRTLADTAGYNGEGKVVATLASGIDFYSTVLGTAGFDTGTWGASTKLILKMAANSALRGRGGDGGDALTVDPSEAGEAGSDAVNLQHDLEIDMQGLSTPVVFGGGGGGGGGGKGSLNQGGGGGGGAGRNAGAGGAGIGGGSNGTAGTETAKGTGGAKGGASSGDGGDGGDPGAAGVAGQNGTTGNGGAAGAAGKAINLNGNTITWTDGTPPASQLKGAVS